MSIQRTGFVPRGTYTALVTPFRDGRLDEGRLREQVAFQLDAGVEGVVAVGTTGESPTLSFEEHERVIEIAVESAQGRAAVVAGTGANATDEAIRLHRHAADVGADAGLSVNPYYNKPTQDGLYRHYMAITQAVPQLPIVLYNIPGRCGVNMTPATVARLYEYANVAAVKEATGGVEQTSDILARCGCPVLSGDDPLTLPLMAIGAIGVTSVVSNVLPREVKRLVDAMLAGDVETARQVHFHLLAFTKSLFLDGNPAGVKHAMKLLGRDGGDVRLPLSAVSAETAGVIGEELRRLELL